MNQLSVIQKTYCFKLDVTTVFKATLKWLFGTAFHRESSKRATNDLQNASGKAWNYTDS